MRCRLAITVSFVSLIVASTLLQSELSEIGETVVRILYRKVECNFFAKLAG